MAFGSPWSLCGSWLNHKHQIQLCWLLNWLILMPNFFHLPNDANGWIGWYLFKKIHLPSAVYITILYVMLVVGFKWSTGLADPVIPQFQLTPRLCNVCKASNTFESILLDVWFGVDNKPYRSVVINWSKDQRVSQHNSSCHLINLEKQNECRFIALLVLEVVQYQMLHALWFPVASSVVSCTSFADINASSSLVWFVVIKGTIMFKPCLCFNLHIL